MINPPGGELNGFIALVLVNGLIATLKRKGIIDEADTRVMLERILEALDKDPRAIAKSAAPILRSTIEH